MKKMYDEAVTGRDGIETRFLQRVDTRVNQKFFNILVTWGKIQQLQGREGWRTTLVSEMSSSPDTLQVILIGF